MSFPVNGKFTKDQALVYNAVLSANRAVLDAAKPETSWKDLHLLANRVVCEHMVKAEVLTGKTSGVYVGKLNRP